MNNLEQALNQPCIADTSLLSNFIHSGSADLLQELLPMPVYIPPSILDPEELSKLSPSSGGGSLSFASEFLKPLAKPEYGEYHGAIRDFALSDSWHPIELDEEALSVAANYRTKEGRADIRKKCPDLVGRAKIDPGEAEVLALASKHSWTMLVDDNAAVSVARCLYPNIPVIRTCQLLAHMAIKDLRPCETLARLFNSNIVDKQRFYAYRNGGKERLWLYCEPPRCDWEAVAA